MSGLSPKMRKSLYWIFFTALIIIFVSTVFLYHKVLDITTFPENGNNLVQKQQKPMVQIGVVSRFSPHLLYEGYQPLMDYLSKETPYHFSLRLSHSYRETIEQLVDGSVVAAFLGTYIYIQSREENNLNCLLKPLNENGKPYFHSVVITASDSIQTIKQIKNHSLALPSPDSYSANWLFKQSGFTANDFSGIHYFDFHNTVVYQVLKGNYDVGIVKDRIANDFSDAGIRVIGRSPSIPASPIVVHRSVNPEIRATILQALSKIDVSKPEYRELVRNWDAEFQHGFVEAHDSEYPVEVR